MKFLLLILSLSLLTACTNLPQNSVGAAYDADSYYCRALHNDEYEVTGSFRGSAPSNQDLYTKYCEPIGSWQARDVSGYESKIRSESSLLNSFLDLILD